MGKKALKNVVIPLARDNLPGLVSDLALNAISKFERKISGEAPSQQEKDLFIITKIRMILLRS